MRLHLELLEDRQLPAVIIPLDPARDQFGSQIVALQRYQIDPEYFNFDGFLNNFTIFDSGSPFMSFGYYTSQQSFGDGDIVPVKVPGGAIADAIGGRIAADVGLLNFMEVQGISGLSFTFEDETGYEIYPPQYEATWGDNLPKQLVQPVVTPLANGDSRPEYELPTLAGMPILSPSTRFPLGQAALIDFTGATIDFTIVQLRDNDGDGLPDYGDESPWIIKLPDLNFVTPGTQLLTEADESTILRIPLIMEGGSNLTNPGNSFSRAAVPVQNNVDLRRGDAASLNHRFLLDTGAQLTTISRSLALSLGLDLENPETTTTIIGAAGRVEDVPGFTLDSLTLPLADGEELQFTNVPVYVIDVAGYDGLLGTNLFGTTSRMMLDPFSPEGPTLSLALQAERPADGEPISEAFFFTLQDAGLVAVLDNPSGFPLPVAAFQGGQITGQVYHDVNRDKKLNAADSSLADVTIFADLNNNGQRDQNEPFTNSGVTGLFSLSGLTPGRKYTIRQEAALGLVNLDAAPTVRVRTDRAVTDLLFRNVTPPPNVDSIQINDGAQRSSVKSITITFNALVTLNSTAIEVTRSNGKKVPINWEHSEEFGRTVVTISFPGNSSRGGSLNDGLYQLRLRADRIRAQGDGQYLDGNNNYVAGPDFKYTFHRLFGDVNGDRKVDLADYQLVQQALAAPTAYGYLGLDYRGDGSFDNDDLLRFQHNFAFYKQKYVRLFRSVL